MKNVTLFYKPTCGYCRKVLNFLERNNIKINLKNVTENSSVFQELIELAGKSQVPCLLINGKPMHESDDIIQWFKDNWGQHDYA